MSGKQPFTPPQFEVTAFNCPFCNAYAKQNWHTIEIRRSYEEDTKLCYCTHCQNYSIWYNQKMVYPKKSNIEPCNQDLNASIREDYQEAASIVYDSPRGAAALLRLAIQKLCKQLGQKGKNINKDIGNLVKEGLPIKVQESLDALRVIGNESVHPGEIDIKDDIQTALSLFELINFIAEKMITQPKQIEAIYKKIPDSKKEQIKQRDEQNE